MKKALFALCLAFGMLLTGCGTTGDTTSTASGGTGTTNIQADTAGFTFTYQGHTFSMHQKLSEVVDAIGEPIAKTSSPNCAGFSGVDWFYNYGAFEVTSYPVDDVDYLSRIRLVTDEVETAEGIAIGSSEADMLAAYGTPTSESSGLYTFEKSRSRLQILVKDGSVSEIDYYAIYD